MQNDLEAVASGTEFQSEVCIAGAGVAGLILAQRLSAAGIAVHVLEAGGESPEPRSQELYQGEMRGRMHTGTAGGRFRTFGGSSTQWAGQLLPYPDENFQKREAVDGISWPISGKDLAEYYPAILNIMGADDLPYTEQFLEKVGARSFSTEEIRLRFSKWSPFSRRNLGNTLGKECLASKHATVFLHANVTSINLHPDGNRVESLSVKNYQGGEFVFKASTFVLCCGTIETSRLLLASNRVQKAGVGNAHDQVGRYFHDHVTACVSHVQGQDRIAFNRYFAPYYLQNTLHTVRMEASPQLQESATMLGVMGGFYIYEPEDSGFAILRQILKNFQRGKFSFDAFGDPRKIPSALYEAGKSAFELKIRRRRFPAAHAQIDLRIDSEQRPRPDSRILLSDQMDVLGMPKVVVDWKISEDEATTLHRYAVLLHSFLNSLGLTTMRWVPGSLESPEFWMMAGHDVYHPMGGTRMGDTPEKSVVNDSLQVHGIANLYLASCSTFPTGGSSNPTFTLMALSLRLADRLRREQGR